MKSVFSSWIALINCLNFASRNFRLNILVTLKYFRYFKSTVWDIKANEFENSIDNKIQNAIQPLNDKIQKIQNSINEIKNIFIEIGKKLQT